MSSRGAGLLSSNWVRISASISAIASLSLARYAACRPAACAESSLSASCVAAASASCPRAEIKPVICLDFRLRSLRAQARCRSGSGLSGRTRRRRALVQGKGRDARATSARKCPYEWPASAAQAPRCDYTLAHCCGLLAVGLTMTSRSSSSPTTSTIAAVGSWPR